MSRRQRLRRRFLRRWTPYYGAANALRIWNGQELCVECTLGQPDRVSFRPAGSDLPWQELRGVSNFEWTQAPLRGGKTTRIRERLRGLLPGRRR